MYITQPRQPVTMASLVHMPCSLVQGLSSGDTFTVTPNCHDGTVSHERSGQVLAPGTAVLPLDVPWLVFGYPSEASSRHPCRTASPHCTSSRVEAHPPPYLQALVLLTHSSCGSGSVLLWLEERVHRLWPEGVSTCPGHTDPGPDTISASDEGSCGISPPICPMQVSCVQYESLSWTEKGRSATAYP